LVKSDELVVMGKIHAGALHLTCRLKLFIESRQLKDGHYNRLPRGDQTGMLNRNYQQTAQIEDKP